MKFLKAIIFFSALIAVSQITEAQWISNAGKIYPSTLTDKVGIGHNSPTTYLHIKSPDFTHLFLERTVAGGSGIKIGTFVDDWNIGVGNSGHFGIYQENNVFGQEFFIDRNSSFVGIGSLSPSHKLTVAGDTYVNGHLVLAPNTITGGTPGALRFSGADFQGFDGVNWKSLTAGGSSGSSVWTQSAGTATYTTGFVGVGTSTPDTELHVASDAYEALTIERQGVGGAGVVYELADGTRKIVGLGYNGDYGIYTEGATFGDDIIVKESGRVAIHEFNPTHDFHVGSDMALAGSLWHPSDRRLKENIQSIENASAIIAQLEGATYTYKKEMSEQFGLPTSKQFGLIAQDVQKVIPEIVTNEWLTDDEGTTYMGIDYEKLIPLLLTAVKEQQATIETLEQSNQVLLDRVSKVEAKITQ